MKISLTREQIDRVEENLDDWSMGEEANVRRAYSGRGMYGATCVGIVHDGGTVPAAFLYFVAEEIGMDFLELLTDLGGGSRDSMAFSTITYWRNLTVEGASDEDDEGE